MECILSVDLGGSSLRAGLVDRAGGITHRAVVQASAPIPVDGVAEVEPGLWWEALAEAVERLEGDAGAALDAVEAVAITGFTRTQVFLDAAGQALRPAPTWQDTRAADSLAAIEHLLPTDHPERAALNPFHPVARLEWLRRSEPETLSRLAVIVEPKDYLNLRLTGVVTSDPISSARLVAAAEPGRGRQSILDALGLPRGVVPPLRDPGTALGRVRAGLPGAFRRLQGRPVMTMANDTWTAVVGLGAMRDGYAYNLSGTTEVFGTVARRHARAEGLLDVAWGEGLHQLGGPSLCGGDTLVWLVDLLGRSGWASREIGADLDLLLSGPRDPQALLFLPFLQGERTPFWDVTRRGAFIGLNRRHGPSDCAMAVLEGIALLNRVVLERAEAALDRKVSQIRFGGGGAASATWSQIKADVTGCQVAVTECEETGLLGGALVAWTALGAFASLSQAQEELVRIARLHEPDLAKAARYERMFTLFCDAERALRPISAALAETAQA